MWKKAYAQGKSAAVACDALGETGKGMVNYPVSQKRLGVSESCWREDQQQGQFFNVHLAGPVAWGARLARLFLSFLETPDKVRASSTLASID